ncbi:MAG: glycerophosphodiester phosphodiesterase [Actinomycetota bacterium]|nr:glycerophosphodiester phosphodiesterase [Actinomycetota bacterium]MDQ3497359.1 glycerophosphodiester phosphodiesterase [Actinomycetota bacterium]MDQ3604021.1 glycerophosphodiester phosphodiesterase [Actinomycetota bacterium]
MRRNHFVLISLAGLACSVALILRKGRHKTVQGEWPVNLAHRGASSLAPENTIKAFRLAVEAGAGGLELDVHLTRDGHVVVLHDATVDRTTDGEGPVSEMTIDELCGFDAGYNFSLDGELARPYRGRGVRVPTLEEVLREFPGVAVNIDIKAGRPGIEGAVFGVLREADALGRVLVVSTPHATVKRFRKVSGGHVSTGASKWEIGVFYLLSRLRLDRLVRPAYDALQVPLRHRGITLVTSRFIRAAHDRGVRVDVWTINQANEMRRLLDLGADVIMTDRPRTLAEVLRERET